MWISVKPKFLHDNCEFGDTGQIVHDSYAMIGQHKNSSLTKIISLNGSLYIFSCYWGHGLNMDCRSSLFIWQWSTIIAFP